MHLHVEHIALFLLPTLIGEAVWPCLRLELAQLSIGRGEPFEQAASKGAGSTLEHSPLCLWAGILTVENADTTAILQLQFDTISKPIEAARSAMQYPAVNSPKKEILVVDDTPDNLRLLSAILTQKNYEVRKALSSKQALLSIQADAPDLVLLDIRMPEMDGIAATREIRRRFPSGTGPSIIALTAAAMEADERR